MDRRRLTLLTGVLLTATAGGCSLTPAPDTPGLVSEIRASDGYYGAALTRDSLPDSEDWWLSIGGEELDGLVRVLLADSLTLQEVRLQAEQAREGQRIATGQRLPSVAARGDVSANRSPDPFGAFSWSEAYSAGLLVDFSTDIFGGLRAAARAAELNALSSTLLAEASEQREIALLAINWVAAATLQRRLEVANQTADSFRATYELTNQRYQAGSANVSASDVQIALQNLETSLVDILQIETELAKQFLVIDEQLARQPGETELSFLGEARPLDVSALAVGRPARLLASRPDVAAAELRYLAALEDIGAARASLYPAMSLGASLTFQSDEPGDLFDWDRHIASLANSLAAPVFQGGRLRAQVRLEEARAQELAATFARTALTAVIDVETALADLSGLERQRAQLATALETAELSNALAQGRYREGLTSILSVLETQRSLNSAQQNLILTEQALVNARIELFLSLGGDWAQADAAGAP